MRRSEGSRVRGSGGRDNTVVFLHKVPEDCGNVLLVVSLLEVCSARPVGFLQRNTSQQAAALVGLMPYTTSYTGACWWFLLLHCHDTVGISSQLKVI